MTTVASDVDELERLAAAVDAADAAIANLILQRTRLERQRQSCQVAAGGPRITHRREIELFQTFHCLGASGSTVATELIRLARSPRQPGVAWHDLTLPEQQRGGPRS